MLESDGGDPSTSLRMTKKTMDKVYNHKEFEEKIYKEWEEKGYFKPEVHPEGEPYSIILPPPNVTGVLHMGHAFEDTLQDILIRFQRMRGKKVLWLPGTDHAAIATQAKYEKELYKKEKKSRHDYTRKEFFNKVQEFALSNQSAILTQLHKMGLSLDWTRLAFTLDESRGRAVRTAFKKMYDAGLIYRAHRVVNWDPKGKTTVSDDEIEHEETTAKLYTFRYTKDFPIAIATTRPETKVGDTAVAVHPDDPRYKKYIGQEFDLVFCGVSLHIKVIGERDVDPKFGTGALGVTPAHSMVDYEIARRNNLPIVPVINEYAKMTVGGEALEGKKTTEARQIIVEMLQRDGLIEKEEEISQNLSKAQRTGGIIEPLPKLQWFINVNRSFVLKKSKLTAILSGEETTLKDIMRKTVANGQITITPDRFSKTYSHWIENLRDWCISRQIIYGHRIPVWYRGEEVYCGTEAPTGDGWEQDHDTLDTWFSSGLWTFSTLGWPDETQDFKTYHPTSVIVPGYEILFFWVARMILMTGFLLEDIPFHKVYLHGMVRDKQGRKFSKSLNNGVDPLEMIEKYGTDGLRMALVFGAASGSDVVFDEDKVRGMKFFANKLWNIGRFIEMYRTEDEKQYANLEELLQDQGGMSGLASSDQDMVEELGILRKSVTGNIENFRLHEAALELYQYIWHKFADYHLEEAKRGFTSAGGSGKPTGYPHYQLIKLVYLDLLKLLHPFMPFITEAIYKTLFEKDKSIMIEPWPA